MIRKNWPLRWCNWPALRNRPLGCSGSDTVEAIDAEAKQPGDQAQAYRELSCSLNIDQATKGRRSSMVRSRRLACADRGAGY